MTEFILRSDGGLSNQHLFYGVDLIIYTEGGPPHTSINHAINQGCDETHDSAFWGAIFRSLRPNLSIHVKSVGSKDIAKQISARVHEAQISNIVICVDRDFDEPWTIATGEPPECRSWAYSWEGDLARLDVMEATFFRLRPPSIRARQIFEDYAAWHAQFIESVRNSVCRDKERVLAGSNGVFVRDKPQRCLANLSNAAPTINESLLQQRAESPLETDQPIIPIEEAEICAHRNCFGKVLILANYHAIMFFTQKLKRGRVDFDTFLNIAISTIDDVCVAGTELFQYYNSQITVH